MRNYTLLLILILSTLSTVTYAHKIKGKIVDQTTHKAIGNAIVTLLKADSTTFQMDVTDAEGNYEIETPPYDFDLVVSNMGYQTYQIHLLKSNRKEIELDPIALQSMDIDIGEVTVTGTRIKEQGVKSIAFATQKQKENATTGTDLIGSMQLPGLTYNPTNQSLSIDGTSGIVYRINGMESNETQVKALMPSEVDHIEYSRIPTMRELNSNSGVINVITKKPKLGTYFRTDWYNSFQVLLIDGTFNYRRVFPHSQLSVNYHIRQFTLNEITGWAYQQYNAPTDTIYWNYLQNNSMSNNRTNNVYAEYVYKDSINSFSIKFQSDFSPSKRNNRYVFNDENNLFLFNRDSYNDSRRDTPSMDFYWIHQTDTVHRYEMHLLPSIAASKTENLLTDQYKNYTDSVPNNTKEIDPSVGYEYLYSIDNKKYNLSIGTQLKYNFARTFLDNVGNKDTAKVHWLDIYPYVNLSGKLSPKINYSVGTGIKYTYSNDLATKMNFVRNLSMLNLFYGHSSKWNINNNFSFTPSYPSLGDLNDMDVIQDSLNMRRGNPFLKPSTTIRNQLYFTYNPFKIVKLTLGVLTSKTHHPIHPSYSYDSTTGYFVTQNKNQNSDLNITLNWDFKITGLWDMIDFSFTPAWSHYESRGDDYNLNLNDFHWWINFMVYYKRFRLNGTFCDGFQTLNGPTQTYEMWPVSDLSLQYKVKTLFLGVNVGPIGSVQFSKSQRFSDTMPLRNQSKINDIDVMVCLKLNYTFSRGLSIIDLDKKL